MNWVYLRGHHLITPGQSPGYKIKKKAYERQMSVHHREDAEELGALTPSHVGY
jgi:hypothetical protein